MKHAYSLALLVNIILIPSSTPALAEEMLQLYL